MSRPGDIESVTVTWMDGEQETYPCNRIEIADGELRLSSVYSGNMVTVVKNESAFPLANIRVHTVERTGW